MNELYYVNRKEDMRHLRFVLGWSLQKIGDNYSVSRQRVNQILGKTRGALKLKYADTLENPVWLKINSDKTNEELSILTGACESYVAACRNNVRHKIRGNGGCYVGAKWEDWASGILLSNNIPNKLMGHHHPFDITAFEKIRIDVKVATKPWEPPSLKTLNPMWRFKVGRKGKRKDTDLYLLVIADSKDVFIVPSNIIPPSRLHIAFTWPCDNPKQAKWQQYHNRFDLITGEC